MGRNNISPSSGKNLPSFKAKGKCAKCGSSDLHTHHCEGSEWVWECCLRVKREHLHRRCNRCQWEWAEKCVGSRLVAGREVVSGPGAAIKVERIELTEEGKRALRTGVNRL